jgi:hypothetical protein
MCVLGSKVEYLGLLMLLMLGLGVISEVLSLSVVSSCQ